MGIELKSVELDSKLMNSLRSKVKPASIAAYHVTGISRNSPKYTYIIPMKAASARSLFKELSLHASLIFYQLWYILPDSYFEIIRQGHQ